MGNLKSKVLVAMSGGIDSSIATSLLLEQGYECSGVYMITNDNFQKALLYAEKVADKLSVNLQILDLREDFDKILDYFCNEYSRGRTPNPCVICNRLIKFGKLWDIARENGANFLATGHYARILKKNGDFCLYKGVDELKEQSYFLAMINREMLSNILLPMGDYTKEKTRKLFKKFDLGCEHREESQEICFLPKNWESVLEERHPELVRKGNIIDSSNSVLGQHQGTHRFTIGQRRGLGVAMGEPYYVKKIDADTNTVTLGPKEEVMHNSLVAKDLNWMADKPQDSFHGVVQVRYNSRGKNATIYPEKGYVKIDFAEKVLAATPGQLAVCYNKDENGEKVVFGGWIDRIIE